MKKITALTIIALSFVDRIGGSLLVRFKHDDDQHSERQSDENGEHSRGEYRSG